MRTAKPSAPWITLVIAGSLILVSERIFAQANPSETATQKSVFEEKLRSGKDPFFPNSSRRQEKVVVANSKTHQAPVVQLFLKAITGTTTHKLALINNQTFAAGEEGFVRVPNGQVRIQCVEIKENSVVVTVEGDPARKELKLREGL